ncbi:MAG TPA: hypothetical protein VJ836_06725 [Candidatus Saccharimonadales bacterium]|nr:hypothetical protein [Candidatus Saccharimonadales bacterium]
MSIYTIDYPPRGLHGQNTVQPSLGTKVTLPDSVAEIYGSVGKGPFAEPMQDFREGWASLRERWDGMSLGSRCLYAGSGVVSVAAFGYLTVTCGPIPSTRKLLAGLPDYIGRENRDWFRYAMTSLTAPITRGIRAGGEQRKRHRATAVAAMVMAASSLCPVNSTLDGSFRSESYMPYHVPLPLDRIKADTIKSVKLPS